MSLIQVPLVIHDKTGRNFPNFKVKTFYVGKPSAFTEHISDSSGKVKVTVSADRKFEVHVIKPDGSYEKNCVLNSTRAASREQIIAFERTIEDYSQPAPAPTPTGVVNFYVKVVDSTGKAVKNFPVQTSATGKTKKSPDKYTNAQGIVELKASANRDVDIWVLNLKDAFEKITTVNSGVGNNTNPIVIITLTNPISKYRSKIPLKFTDVDGTHLFEHAEFEVTTSFGTFDVVTDNGKKTLITLLGDDYTITLKNPGGNGTFIPVTRRAIRLVEKEVKLKANVNITEGVLAQGEPVITQTTANPLNLNIFLLEASSHYNGLLATNADYTQIATAIGCEVASIKAVAKKETGPQGPFRTFKTKQLPCILYERHYFRNLTASIYNVNYPTISGSQGGYGVYSAQYPKLETAMGLNQSAALKSCSWGKFQIMGANYIAAGFANVEDIVKTYCINEIEQLKSFQSFILADNVLKNALINKQWHTFALRYNGPNASSDYWLDMASNYTYFTSHSSELP